MRRRIQAQSPTIFGNLNDWKSEFEQARVSHLRREKTGIPFSGAGADWHIRSESHWLRLIELPRALDRDSPVLRQGLNRVCGKIAGKPFMLDPDTGDKSIDQDLFDEFDGWANDKAACDITGQSTLTEMAWQGLRATWLDGDQFTLPMENGSLKTFEAHRCRSAARAKLKSTGTCGVQTDNHGKPIRYFFTEEDCGYQPGIKVGQLVAVEAYDERMNEQVFHLFRRERSSQGRGISVVAPVLDVNQYHDDTTFVTCLVNQLQSFFAVIHEIEGNAPPMASMHGEPVKGDQVTTPMANGSLAMLESMLGPIEITGRPGEKIKGFSPTMPGVQFAPFMLHLLALVACNLNIPLAVLLLDAERTGSYSAWRGAMNEAREGFQAWQSWLINKFYSPVYRWRLQRIIDGGGPLARAAKRLKAKFFRHQFKPPAWDQIDPHKDTASDVMQEETAQRSHRRIRAANGIDYELEHRHWVEDRDYQIEMAIQAALKKVEKYGDQLKEIGGNPCWRDWMPLSGGQAGVSLISRAIDVLNQPDEPVAKKSGEKNKTAV